MTKISASQLNLAVHDQQAELVKDIPETEHETLLSALKNLLVQKIELLYEVPSPNNDAFAARIVNQLLSEIRSLPPAQRLSNITQQLLELKIARLDRQSQILTKLWLGVNPKRAVLRRQAEEILHETQQLLETLDAPSKQLFGRMLSEILAECNYISGISKDTSLRMGRLLKHLSEN